MSKLNIVLAICVTLAFAGCTGVQMNVDSNKILTGMGTRGAGVALGLALKTPEKADMAREYLTIAATGSKDPQSLKIALDWGMGWVREEVKDPLLMATIDDLYNAIEFQTIPAEGETPAKLTLNFEWIKANLPMFLEGLELSKSYMK